MLVEVVGTALCPILGLVELIGDFAAIVGWPPAPAGVILVDELQTPP